MKKFLRQFWMSISLTLAILVLCFIPSHSLPGSPVTNFDKIVHFIMFMILSLVVYWDGSLRLKKALSWASVCFGVFLFPLLLSGSIEIMQEHFTTTRSGEWMDFLSDGIGVIVALTIVLLMNRRNTK